MNRLEFLKRLGLISAGAVVAGAGLSTLAGLQGCSSEEKKRSKLIGLQLYSLRDEIGQNVSQTLKKVATMGYTNLETASYGDGMLYGMPAAEFRQMVEALGMKVTSAHLGPAYTKETKGTAMEWWRKAIDTHAQIECPNVVLPSMSVGEQTTLDDLKDYCQYFNEVGEMAAQSGLKFGYHNHSHEFVQCEGVTAYDYLVENTSNNVNYELDVYWCAKAGKDPVEYINRYGKRIPLLHIKDESIIGDSGTIDFEPIFNAAYANGMEDFFVEVERYTMPAEICVERSYDFLFGAEYVK